MKYADVKNDFSNMVGFSITTPGLDPAKLVARQLNAIAGELDGVSYNLKQAVEEIRQFRTILASMLEKKQGNRRK